jgi:hypothetical protein
MDHHFPRLCEEVARREHKANGGCHRHSCRWLRVEQPTGQNVLNSAPQSWSDRPRGRAERVASVFLRRRLRWLAPDGGQEWNL